MGLFSNWLGVWPKDLPRLYPQADDRSLSAFLTDADYAGIQNLPIVVMLPLASEESAPLDRAFGVGLARLLIRDLMLVANLSVHDQDDTPHLYLESAVEGHKNRDRGTIWVTGRAEVREGLCSVAFTVLRPGKPAEEFTVAGTQFKEFLFDCAAIVAASLGGKISGENRILWALGRPSTIIELLDAGKLLIADLTVRQRSRLALELWSKDPEFSLPFLLVEGEPEQEYRAKMLDAFRRDCGNAALCLRLFSTVRENKGYEPYALQYARRACELSPGYGRAHIAAAMAINSDVDAMRHFELGYRLLPGSLYAIRHYLTTLVKADRPVQELTEVVRQGININPYDPDNYRSLIDTFVELKKYRHALEIAKGLQQLFEPEINPRTRTCLERNPKFRHLLQVGGYDPVHEVRTLLRQLRAAAKSGGERTSMVRPTSEQSPKLFVLDTNVILHDAGCIRNFQENDIAIPITVLEELDRFKKGDGDINAQAREFLRRLDQLTGDVLSPNGASLGDSRGSIRVVLGGGVHERIQAAFFQDSPDHRILATALTVQEREPARRVILVSKDTNLRMKAKSLEITAQDYTSDKIESFDKLYTGKRVIEGTSGEWIDAFYADGGVVPADRMPEVSDPLANENFVLRNGSKSVLATYRAFDKTFARVEKVSAYGIKPRNAEQSFALRALVHSDIRLVTLVGKAGTGKTILALAAALECRSSYRQILLARPTVPLSNRDLGYLPGDISAKLDPYMQPLYDNLGVIRHQFDDKDAAAHRIGEMLSAEKLVVTPLTYIRGRSLQRCFLIVDEAQNLTPHEIKTIITRAGEGTKMVFTGDIQQIDHPYLDSLSNGMSYLISRMTGQPIYAHVTLEKGERSALADLASDLL